MGKRIDAYVDTSALISFADRSDTHHALFRKLFGDPPSLITCASVIAEAHGWFLRRYDQTKALQFLHMVELMRPLRIGSVGGRELNAAAQMLRRFSDQSLTLVDALGLCMMQAHRIASCWSTDRHLSLTGVPLVIHG